MTRPDSPAQVFDAIQQAKGRATAYCTNFFPTEPKLRAWLERGELCMEAKPGVAFFFRNDRDFQRLYFCAASELVIEQGMTETPAIKAGPLMTDLVGNESTVNQLAAIFERAGFRRYARLQRLARIGPSESKPDPFPDIEFAAEGDAPVVLDLLENLFDRHAEQLPMLYEIESAIKTCQIIVARAGRELAGLLFFETQGFASSVRFWALKKKFHSQRIGSRLMRRYFSIHPQVRRFSLWVNAENVGAISKYQHYGYAPDGLLDLVLAGKLIPV